MRNFSSSCLLPWLPALECRQLNRFGGFLSPSCHVWVRWSLLFTKPWFKFQRVLTYSCNLTPTAPAQSSSTHPSQSEPQQIASLATRGSPAKEHAPFPSQTITSFSKTPTAFYTELFTLPVGPFQDLCFCPAYQEGRLFDHINWIKRLLKSFCLLATSIKTLPYWCEFFHQSWLTGQLNMAGGQRKGKRGVLGFLH